MSVALHTLTTDWPDHELVFEGVSWESHVELNDAVEERHCPRMTYVDGRLTILTLSRPHDWFAERLAEFAKNLAQELQMLCEDAGSATYRRKRRKSGVEGDKTFYFGEHAEIMKGSKKINLRVQPPPDLAIDVEVSRSAEDKLIAWGRLGVPEVWRFDPIEEEAGFYLRRKDGTYDPVDRSLAFPVLTPTDLVEQMRLPDRLGAARWNAQLTRSIRKIIKKGNR
jgi:Uma2 family endonuclease